MQKLEAEKPRPPLAKRINNECCKEKTNSNTNGNLNDRETDIKCNGINRSIATYVGGTDGGCVPSAVVNDLIG